MTQIRSYSLSDADPRNRVVRMGVKQFGGHSEFIRRLLDLYAEASRRNGGMPLEDRFSEAYLQSTAEEKERLASIALKEAEQARVMLDEARELRERGEAPACASPEELVEAAWPSLPPPGPARTKHLRDLAERHGFDAQRVMKAAATRHKLEAQHQSTLRALTPKPPKTLPREVRA